MTHDNESRIGRLPELRYNPEGRTRIDKLRKRAISGVLSVLPEDNPFIVTARFQSAVYKGIGIMMMLPQTENHPWQVATMLSRLAFAAANRKELLEFEHELESGVLVVGDAMHEGFKKRQQYQEQMLNSITQALQGIADDPERFPFSERRNMADQIAKSWQYPRPINT